MNNLSLSKTWQVLGPFPIGTREQDFGADPLEDYGGFRHLKYSSGAKYPSELVDGGFVGWITTTSNKHTVGPVDFSNSRWQENGIPFGWSIEQYQAWARGLLIVYAPVQLFIQVEGAAEFYINNKRYHGDYYGYNTTKHIIYLGKGKHQLDVRMVHDVRVFGGGKSPPQCQFKVLLDAKDETLVYPEDCAIVMPSYTSKTVCELLMPDYLKDVGFAGSYGSVCIQNAGDDHMTVQSVTLCIVDEHSLEANRAGLFVEYKTNMLINQPLTIVPGQTRPIGFRFEKEWGALPPTKIMRLWVRIELQIHDQKQQRFGIRASADVRCIDWLKSAFKYTFLDYDRTVHYAMVKRPEILTKDIHKPVVVALHGAGVEVDGSFWIDSIPAQAYSWVVFPTGRTSWGYDWHGPSTLNIFSSLDGLAELQDLLPPHFECIDSANEDWVNVAAPHETKKTLKPKDHREWIIGDKERLIVMGHSNGGQGVWHLAVHYPDKIIAIIPAAGYVKIQDYVSFANWIGGSFCDPILKGILESSITEYNNDLHLSNMADLAVLPRVGTKDDNVPPLHTRKYVRILNGLLKDPTALRSSEAVGEGHWFDSVFKDKTVQDFLSKQLQAKNKTKQDEFCVTLINPAANGSVNGILVEQMMIPFRLGKIKGVRTKVNQTITLTLNTTNIASFRLLHFEQYHTLIVDGNSFSCADLSKEDRFTFDNKTRKWKLDMFKLGDRKAKHYGPIHRLYESLYPLKIIIPRNETYKHVALQIAHDWLLYGRGDSVILYEDEKDQISREKHYTIYLGLPTENKRMYQLLQENHTGIAFQFSHGSITGIKVDHKVYDSPGTGILFMQPGPTNSNEIAVIVSGIDPTGFDSAWRLLPKRTGMMIPEWIVTSQAMKSTGIGGIIGAGYFDNDWKPFGYL